MAKTAWINRNERKRATVKKYAALRAELKAKKDYAGLSQYGEVRRGSSKDAAIARVASAGDICGV